MYAQTRLLFILSSERGKFRRGRGGEDGNAVRTHVYAKGKIPYTGKILLIGGSNPPRSNKQDSEPNTLPTSYSGPRREVKNKKRTKKR